MRIIFTILLTLLIYKSTWASIISLSTTGSTLLNNGQSEQITIDYLKVNLYQKLINLSVPYLKKSKELAGKNYSDDEIRDLATAITKISFSDINISNTGNTSNISMTLTVYIDTDTINRFIIKSLENNQFKAFAKNLYNDLIIIETDLLTSKKDTEYYLLKKVAELFYIQRRRAYEMNQLALSGYLDNKPSEESAAYKKKHALKESNIDAILEDIDNYDKLFIASINQSINNAMDLSKTAITQIKTYRNRILEEPIIFNDVPTHDLISAKNESISVRKQIATLIKTFNFYSDNISEELTNSLNDLEKQLKLISVYEPKPMRAKWEASYQYQFRLNNYNKKLERIQPLLNINIDRIKFINSKALLEIDIINYISLIKILSPFEVYLKKLQNAQYLGPEIDRAYIMNVGELNISKSKITLPFTVRYEGEEYIFNFDISDFDQDKIIYLIENPSRFSVAPTFRLNSSGPTPYDVTQVQSGFSIYHRTDNFSEIFTINNTFTPFPETNLSDRLKTAVQFKIEKLNNLINIEKDDDLQNISHLIDLNYNELKLSDLTNVQATEEQVISVPTIEQAVVEPIQEIIAQDETTQEVITQDETTQEVIAQDETTQEVITQDETTQEIIAPNETTQEVITQDETTKPSTDTQSENAIKTSLPAAYYEYFDNLSGYDYLFKPKPVNRYYGAIFAHLASKLQSSDSQNLGYTLGTIGIAGQYQFDIPLALEAQINYTTFNNGSNDFFLVATKQIDYLLFVLFQYPIFLNNFSFIPFIGIGAGASSIFLDYDNDESLDQPLATQNLTNTTAFLLSTKTGLKILVGNFIISTGIQINKLRPELLGKARNMDSYQIFIEAGFSFNN